MIAAFGGKFDKRNKNLLVLINGGFARNDDHLFHGGVFTIEDSLDFAYSVRV